MFLYSGRVVGETVERRFFFGLDWPYCHRAVSLQSNSDSHKPLQLEREEEMLTVSLM